MAAFNTTMIPAAVNTWEKLCLQVALALRSIAGNQEIIIRQADDTTVRRRVVEIIDFTDDAGLRQLGITVYLNVPIDAEVSAGKVFTKVNDLSTANVGANYTTA